MLPLIVGFFLLLFTNATAQVRFPAPSPTQTIKQEFGLGAIEVVYSRPSAKGRKVFGDLVPYGNVWRTGANAATTIMFGDDVTIGDKKIPAGKYGLLTIPGENEWTVIITKQTDVTSPAAYKQDQDVVRVSVKPFQLPFSIETFTIGVGDITSDSCKLELMWDNVYVHVPITTDVDSKVMSQIKEIMGGDNHPYFQAALYYIEKGKDLNQAVTWLDKAIQQLLQSPDRFRCRSSFTLAGLLKFLQQFRLEGFPFQPGQTIGHCGELRTKFVDLFIVRENFQTDQS